MQPDHDYNQSRCTCSAVFRQNSSGIKVDSSQTNVNNQNEVTPCSNNFVSRIQNESIVNPSEFQNESAPRNNDIATQSEDVKFNYRYVIRKNNEINSSDSSQIVSSSPSIKFMKKRVPKTKLSNNLEETVVNDGCNTNESSNAYDEEENISETTPSEIDDSPEVLRKKCDAGNSNKVENIPQCESLRLLSCKLSSEEKEKYPLVWYSSSAFQEQNLHPLPSNTDALFPLVPGQSPVTISSSSSNESLPSHFITNTEQSSSSTEDNIESSTTESNEEYPSLPTENNHAMEEWQLNNSLEVARQLQILSDQFDRNSKVNIVTYSLFS